MIYAVTVNKNKNSKGFTILKSQQIFEWLDEKFIN